MQIENTYVETDLGNIALNPRGEYSDEVSYEYLDTVSYEGGSYICVAELGKSISGIAPAQGKNTEHWQMLTLPGQLTPEAVAMHDDVVSKAKQVETSRAAVELSQQEVEVAQADVKQMRQDTQDASQTAIASRDSAAGYAQSAEASRTAAKESEDNINAQVTEFDAHVAEKTSAAETAITEARRAAVSAVSTKQDNATQAVTDEGDKQIKNVEDAGTEQVGKVKSTGASAVSAAGTAGVSAVNAVKAQQTASIKAIQEAGENALQNISNGVDKGLSEEGKAADAKATGEAISKLTEEVTDIDTTTIEKITDFYQIGNDTMEVGWVYTDKSVGDTGETSTARHLTINNIIGGGTYRYTANGGGNCHAVLWFDDTDSLISYVPFSKAWVQETVEVTAPTDAVKAIVNSNDTSKGELVFEYFGLIRIVKSNPIIEKRVTELEDGTIFEHENIKKRVIENQIKNDFAWGEFDGLYATITFDDTNADIDQLQDLAEELSIPFCYATIPSKLENITSQGTETAKQVLERAVANGGEVLSHWGPQLNSLSKDEDYYNVYAGAKKTLTENGFEVNGIITAGGGTDGTPESFKTQNFLKDIELARIYYKYADLTANDFVSGQDLRYIEQFYNNRTFTDGGVDATKSKIDVMALSGKGWLNLASHGTNNANTPTIDSFRQIFQYAKDKGFTFVTWNTMYEKFKSSKLEKRVKALEIN